MTNSIRQLAVGVSGGRASFIFEFEKKNRKNKIWYSVKAIPCVLYHIFFIFFAATIKNCHKGVSFFAFH